MARALAVGLAAALIATVTACSSGSASGGGAGKPTSGSGSGDITDAQRLVSTAQGTAITGPSFGPVDDAQVVPWTPALMPVPAPLDRTKPITVDVVYGISTGSVPYMANVLKAVGEELGWSVKIVQASGQTQQANLTAMQQALLDRPDAIIGLVVPGVWVGPALEEARKNGIATVNVHQDSSTGDGYDAWVPAAEGIQKSLLAAFAVVDSKGAARSILFDAPGFSDANIPAATDYLAGCGGCSTQTKQLSPTDFTNPVKVQSNISTVLRGSPDTQYLMWPNGALPIQPIITAIRGSQSPGVKLLVNGPSPQGLQMIRDGDLPAAVESPDALLALTAIDDVSRLLRKEQPIAEDAVRLPITLVTTGNLPDSTNYSTLTRSQLSNDFLGPFTAAWGVDLTSTVLGVTS